MSDVHLEYINDVHCRIRAEPGILMELSDKFTFFAENYKYHPNFKNKFWDGKIRLVNTLTGLVYAGLALRIKKYCDSIGYSFSFDKELTYDNVSVNEVLEHIKALELPEWLEIRDYQVEAVVKCLRTRRRTLLSPTSSGKSFMIYLIATWYSQKSLIIVPSTGLVSQFEDDIRSYGFKGKIATSIGGLEKNNDIDADIVITTWQSLENGRSTMPKRWYDQFQVVFGDEAHGCKATSLIKILSAMENTPYRFGTTGTLDNIELNKATIEGLFGPPHTTTTTRELIDQGHASDIKIKCIVLEYPDEVIKEFHKPIFDPVEQKNRKKTYAEEVEFLINYQKRTKFIKNLALSLKGNKLLFFRLVNHGKILHEALKDQSNAFYIDGGVKDREAIRKAMEDEENAILIASLGTTSTGVSIKKLHHMIAAGPLKSKIKVLQSIGRMLRQHKDKEEAYLYDIVDNLSKGAKKNFALKHFEERVNIYDQEKFDYKIYKVKLK
jgi:superfamily II DNA or RNA helicase